jgi:hypothetical protein
MRVWPWEVDVDRIDQMISDPSHAFYGLTKEQADRIAAWLQRVGLLEEDP